LRISGRSGASGPPRDCEVDPLGHCQPIDALQHEGQVEAELELDDDRRLVAAPGNEVAAPDLALHFVALPFEERFYRPIEPHLRIGVIMLLVHADDY
jgi:hypothetical protein